MSECRQRKVQCARCGYTARITRSWLEVGLPGCPCGGKLEPCGDLGDPAASKPQCAYPGCGQWVSAGREHCSEHEHAAELALAGGMPF